MLLLNILFLINVLSAHSTIISPISVSQTIADNKIVVKGWPKNKFAPFKKNDLITIHLAKTPARSIYVLKTGQVRI